MHGSLVISYTTLFRKRDIVCNTPNLVFRLFACHIFRTTYPPTFSHHIPPNLGRLRYEFVVGNVLINDLQYGAVWHGALCLACLGLPELPFDLLRGVQPAGLPELPFDLLGVALLLRVAPERAVSSVLAAASCLVLSAA